IAVFDPFVAVLGRIIYVAGGETKEAETSVLQAYTAGEDRWNIDLRAMPEPLARGCGAHAIRGLIYIVGGWTSEPKPPYKFPRYPLPHDDLFVYDPAVNRWDNN